MNYGHLPGTPTSIRLLREKFVERAGRCSSCGTLRVTEELAAEIGLSRATLWRFVQGRSDATAETRDKIRRWMETR